MKRNFTGKVLPGLTMGSIMNGVLIIYGTTNRLMIIYLIAGVFFTVAGAFSYLLALLMSGRRAASRKNGIYPG